MNQVISFLHRHKPSGILLEEKLAELISIFASAGRKDCQDAGTDSGVEVFHTRRDHEKATHHL